LYVLDDIPAAGEYYDTGIAGMPQAVLGRHKERSFQQHIPVLVASKKIGVTAMFDVTSSMKTLVLVDLPWKYHGTKFL
jgi:hypothetical protein